MTGSAPPAPADVLLVEDDPGDVLLTREAFEDHHLGLQLHVVGDGETALRFLRRTDDFAGMARPALVLLDLNLPRRSGLEGLARSEAEGRGRKVAPLTGSFRGDRMPGAARTARRLWQARSTGMRDRGDRLAAGAGERRGGGGPRRASPTLRQRAWAAAHRRRDSPRPQPPSTGTLVRPNAPLGDPTPMSGARPGPDGPARRRRALD